MKRLVASHRQNHYSSSSSNQQHRINNSTKNNNRNSHARHTEQHRPFLDISDDEEEQQQQQQKPPRSTSTTTSKTSSFLRTLNRLNCVSSTFNEEVEEVGHNDYDDTYALESRQYNHHNHQDLGLHFIPSHENDQEPMPSSVRSKASSKRWLKKNIPKLNCVVPTSSFHFTHDQQQHLFLSESRPILDEKLEAEIPNATANNFRKDDPMEDGIECYMQENEEELAAKATKNHRFVTVKKLPKKGKDGTVTQATGMPLEEDLQRSKSTLVVPRWHLPDRETSPGPIMVATESVRRFRIPTLQNQATIETTDASAPPPREIEILNSPTNHDICAVELPNHANASNRRNVHYEGEVEDDDDDGYFLSPPRLRALATISPPPSIEIHVTQPSLQGTSDAFARAASELANLSPNDMEEVLNQLGVNTTLSSPEISPKVDDVSDLEDEDDEEEEELAALHWHYDDTPRNETKLPVFKPHPINAFTRKTIGDSSHLPVVPKAERAQPNRRAGALDQFVQKELNRSFQYLFNDDAFHAEYNSFSKATHCSEASSTTRTTHSMNSTPENQNHHHHRAHSHDAFQTGHYYSLYKSTKRSEATSSTARTVSSSQSASSAL
jgi:hypothetical protein